MEIDGLRFFDETCINHQERVVNTDARIVHSKISDEKRNLSVQDSDDVTI